MADGTMIQSGIGGIPKWMEILISDDGMKASLLLKPQDNKETLSPEEIKGCLRKAGIQAELKEEVIRRMAEEKLYGEYYLIAEGSYPKNGVNGHYEYFFNTDAETGIPRILPDGKVDYTQIIEIVHKGDLLAQYHRAQKGKRGYKVTGEIVEPDSVADESMLAVSGVSRKNGKYTALFDGRVTLRNARLEVSPSLIVTGDVNNTYGDVKFTGDVFVMGDVRNGMEIVADGSIIVDGMVEGAHLAAGMDIIIGYGVHGDGTALLEASGDVACNFMEGAVVAAKGNVTTDSIIRSDVHAGGKVDVTKEKGVIMGGDVCGMLGVSANEVGHPLGMKTRIFAGASREDAEQIKKLQRSIHSCTSYSEKIRVEEERLIEEMKKAGNSIKGERLKKRAEIVIEEKMQIDVSLGKHNWELRQLLKKNEYAASAVIVVNYRIYDGTEIILAAVDAELPEEIEGARFVKEGDRIVVNPFVKPRKNKTSKRWDSQ